MRRSQWKEAAREVTATTRVDVEEKGAISGAGIISGVEAESRNQVEGAMATMHRAISVRRMLLRLKRERNDLEPRLDLENDF